jgi:hypothetical protein
LAGIFTSQNKIRPGAYTNFKSASTGQINTGDRGVVFLPLVLPWGQPEVLIDITAEEYSQGKAFAKTGLTPGSAEAMPLREAFKKANLVRVYKLNTNSGAIAASKEITSGVTATAALAGTLGNKISIKSEAPTPNGPFKLITTVDGIVVDVQTLAKIGDYVPNGWVEFSTTGSTVLGDVAGVTLTGGTDGDTDITATHWEAAFELASTAKWNVLAVLTEDTAVMDIAKTYISNLRENAGKKVQAVTMAYDHNYEGMISTANQGYKIGAEEISPLNFVAWVAGATAGAALNQSNTYQVIDGATDIIVPLSGAAIEEALKSGKLVISRRTDGAIVVEKDINSLHDFGDGRSYVFSKNRVIRTLDDIATRITTVFENSYIGKVNNDVSGRTLFKGNIVGYLNRLQSLGAISDFDSNADIEVLAGDDIESIVVNLAVKVADSMEKLYMTVVVS